MQILGRCYGGSGRILISGEVVVAHSYDEDNIWLVVVEYDDVVGYRRVL